MMDLLLLLLLFKRNLLALIIKGIIKSFQHYYLQGNKRTTSMVYNEKSIGLMLSINI